MIYFTADWHLGEDRIGINGKPNVFFRPFSSLTKQRNTIINNFLKSGFKDGDTLFHLGDVFYQFTKKEMTALDQLKSNFPNSKFILIVGNYDEGKESILANWFDEIYQDYYLKLSGLKLYLNHYPTKTLQQKKDAPLGLTGHIHGLWKVQPSLINVGVDAWHFAPVSEKEILFCWNAMQKHYDSEVFLKNLTFVE